ncbi:polysaccharide deacetylase family protein [Streptomyces tropicalis]|uniref:Polysaccharide deacetylase family protein n=1 Tax=Streptomyces tropicalis TaxID=3034234 RepID=A0ABT6A903_9ACTN|nr:polysaccharide deacetylase family protein [Streptomyces tropicalis]MDF3301114.1 polysaccharide deacetylase family protein [Streptomyces tropicalis]
MGARGLLAALAGAALASGCARPDAREVRPAPGQERVGSYAARLRASYPARAAAARRWDLEQVPLLPPKPPAVKPEITPRAGFEVGHQRDWDLPPVFTTVPTKDRVVFLTIDDGAEKDPRFLRMMRDLNVPYTAFLSNYLVKDDYGYFRTVQGHGNTLGNHTLHHPYLPGLSYGEQRHEICDMQDIMQRQFGRRPTAFRPPYGNYNQDTLRAAKSCGIRYAPIWNEEVYVDHWEFRADDQRIRPGDIVLTHFRGRREWNGTMTDDMRRFLNKVTAEGFAVARLEDYL